MNLIVLGFNRAFKARQDDPLVIEAAATVPPV
jgi:hypothetical protein